MQQQYRERRFTKYYELILRLLVAKNNNKLLMRNHHSRPTGSNFEVNAIVSKPMDKDVIVEGISNTMKLMVVIIQIPNKRKPHGAIRSGIILR